MKRDEMQIKKEIEEKEKEIDTLKDILFYDLRGKREIDEETIILSGADEKAGVRITINQLRDYLRERKEAKMEEEEKMKTTVFKGRYGNSKFEEELQKLLNYITEDTTEEEV